MQAFQSRELVQQRITKANQKLLGEQDELQKTMQGKLSMQAKLTKTTLEEQKAKLEGQIEEVGRGRRYGLEQEGVRAAAGPVQRDQRGDGHVPVRAIQGWSGFDNGL